MNDLVSKLTKILADSYALYLKTQNYHWNIESHHSFRSLHLLFQDQYEDLANGVDDIAEKIRQLGSKAPASFKSYMDLTNIPDGNINSSADEMLKTLVSDQAVLIKTLTEGIKVAYDAGSEGTADLLIERLRVHEKNKWILESSL